MLICGSMNLGELRDALKQRLSIPSIGDGLLPDSTLNSLINRALQVVSGAREGWPWLLATHTLTFPANDGTAYLPSDFMKSRELLINGYPVSWAQLEDFLNPDRISATYCWTVIGRQAKIAPVPGTTQTGTLYYYRAEPELVTDYATPLMPAHLHSVIIAYAAFLAANVRQDDQRAAAYMAEYKSLLNDMRDDLKVNVTRRIRYGWNRQWASWS